LLFRHRVTVRLVDVAFWFSRSARRRILAVALTGGAVFLLYQATVVDSRTATQAAAQERSIQPAAVDFVATAYCKGETTAAGVAVRSGMAASDPKVLPLGSVVQIEGLPDQHKGIYTVLDTGPKVKGRHLDLYMWSCYEALDFGRRRVKVTVLRQGWPPNDRPSRSAARRPQAQ
jgi:3D (Asp-Asp-Asp) domain-containing protein